jgi:GDPmannose 4,6-dehydratase
MAHGVSQMPTRRALIFGITGQDGYYLRQICERNGVEVVAVSRNDPQCILGDVRDPLFVANLVGGLRCSHIFHLAANSTTNHGALMDNHNAIATGTINILEAVKVHAPESRVFIAGSGLQFENRGLPIRETANFAATSPYVIARNYAAFASRYYRQLGLRVYVGYLFHHDSPLRSEKHLNMKIVKAIQRIRSGRAEKIRVANSQIIKEFNFAGDIMEAAWLLVNQDKVNEAVIGCGKGYTIQEWVEVCCRVAGIHAGEYLESDNDEPREFRSLVADATTILSLGWTPRVSFGELATMMMSA